MLHEGVIKMYIIGALLLVAGVAGCIYGYMLNNSWEAQLSSLFEYGYSDPGTIFIIIGAVCAVLGVVFIIVGFTKKKDNTEYLLICSECGSDNISTHKYCKKCGDCKGSLEYSGFTKTEWFSLAKDERKIVRNRIMTKTSEEKNSKKEPESRSKHCAECGREISLNAKFCPHCGHDSTNAVSKEKPTDKTEALKKHYCQHCGKMISETAAFCPYCGNNPKKAIAPAPVKDDQAEVASEERIYCPHCGNSIKASAAFCPYCSKDVRCKPKKSQLIVNTSKMPELEIPSVEEKTDAPAESHPKIEKKEIEETTQTNVTEVEAVTLVKEEPIGEVYRGKHLMPEDAKSAEEPAPEEKQDELTITASEHNGVLLDGTDKPEVTTPDKPVVSIPRKKELAPPSDLD